MKQIPLTQGKFALVDDEDFEYLNHFKWRVDSYTRKNKYAITTVNNKTVRMHRLLMRCKDGDGKMIDHKDGDCLNNQKYNLRFCTNSENQKNKKPYGTSKYLGVCWHTTKRKYFRKKTKDSVIITRSSWKSSININGKSTHIGLFKNEKDAAKAYNEAALKYHGEFANLNTI